MGTGRGALIGLLQVAAVLDLRELRIEALAPDGVPSSPDGDHGKGRPGPSAPAPPSPAGPRQISTCCRAPLAGVAVVAGTLFGQAVGLADGRIEVDGKWRFANPSSCQQLAAHPVQLEDVAPAKALGGRMAPWCCPGCRPSPRCATPGRRCSRRPPARKRQRHNLVAGVGPARRIAQVQALLYQLGKAGAEPRWLEGAARHWPPGGDRRDAVEVVA